MKKDKAKPEAETAQTEQTQAPQGRLLTVEDEAKIEQALKERDEFLALAQRVQADFDNYRRRNSAAVSEAAEDGIREAMTACLATIDNLDRALASSQDASNPLHKGVEMVRTGLLQSLGKLGLEEVSALGEVFDPELHNAVMQSAAQEGQRDGEILEVFTKGYRFKGKMIRYAMVRVAKA